MANSKILIQSRDHNHAHLGVTCHYAVFLVTLDIAYLCKKFDYSSFSYSGGMIRALKFKGDHVT